jgi:hypothetical protein
MRSHFTNRRGRPASGIIGAEAVRMVADIKETVGATAADRCLPYARAAFGWAEKRRAVMTRAPGAGIKAPT